MWSIINLTWSDDPPISSGTAARARQLREMGGGGELEAALRCALQDPSLDVRERAKTALEQLR